jgi:hypothetical protein
VSRNKLYTLSYFRKRLHEVGVTTRVIEDNYNDGDRRYWTLSIDSEDLRIFCTCIRFTNPEGESVCQFHFSDCKQKFKMDMTRDTVSMEDILTMLSNILNINKKY